MLVGCDSDSEWAYFSFSEAPNLTNTTPESGGYSMFTARVRWDDNVENMRMLQEWGEDTVRFTDGDGAIRRIAAASESLLELKWHGAGDVYFRFPMVGVV